MNTKEIIENSINRDWLRQELCRHRLENYTVLKELFKG